jgi:hypothetical protein
MGFKKSAQESKYLMGFKTSAEESKHLMGFKISPFKHTSPIHTT